MYVDAAYFFTNVVCLSVCRSVCHSRETCKTAEAIEMSCRLARWVGWAHMESNSPMGSSNFEGKWAAHYNV